MPKAMIDYEHSKNRHTFSGPRVALKEMLGDKVVSSLLDVGCGTGTWLRAAKELDIPDVYGIEGVDVPEEQMHVPKMNIYRQDLSQSWDLHRRFDVVLCLEVAEHLDAVYAPVLLDALVRHSDLIFFSAACPKQGGQHHVNGQWPVYWQQLFNERGFMCSDDPRWRIWEDDHIEPWYRQNLFVAQRNTEFAGTEPRIKPVIHPEMIHSISRVIAATTFDEHAAQIERGWMPVGWYFKVPIVALREKFKRHIG